MKYLIGIDGGGTKTKCILTDINFNPIYEITGGPSNFLVIGIEKVSDTILKLINECVTHKEINLKDIEAIVLGTTGGGRRSDAELLESQILKDASQKGIRINKFRVESDARIALEGSFSGKPGSILIAGTGSIMFGKDSSGNIHRVGGFGRFLGDEGSGYTIGKLGLNAISKELDGRQEKSLLSKMIQSELNISSAEELITAVYRNNFDIASAAPIVINAAEKGDHKSQSILVNQADELISHITAMKKLLNEKVMKISLIGGLITTPNYFSYLFNEKVVRSFNDVLIKEAENPPEIGAAMMAKQLIS